MAFLLLEGWSKERCNKGGAVKRGLGGGEPDWKELKTKE